MRVGRVLKRRYRQIIHPDKGHLFVRQILRGVRRYGDVIFKKGFVQPITARVVRFEKEMSAAQFAQTRFEFFNILLVYDVYVRHISDSQLAEHDLKGDMRDVTLVF